MKKKRIVPILALIMLATTVSVVMLRRSSNYGDSPRSFAVKDTASITKVFLSDKSGNNITVTRNAGGIWMVNDSFPAQRDMINRLLKVIYSVEVKSRVAKTAYNTIIKDLAASSTKCEIYLNHDDEPVKVYYVGSHTADALGTFMILDGAEVPFITEIPGFNGYLTPWYPTNLSDWKNRVVFEYPQDRIATIKLEYPSQPQHSFRLDISSNGSKLSPVEASNTQSILLDSVSTMNYLIHFKSLPFETEASLLKEEQKDSILQQRPLAVIQVIDAGGKESKVLLYPMPLTENAVVKADSLGQPLKYDLDRMFGYLYPTGKWVVVQHYTFDPVLRRFGELARSNQKR